MFATVNNNSTTQQFKIDLDESHIQETTFHDRCFRFF